MRKTSLFIAPLFIVILFMLVGFTQVQDHQTAYEQENQVQIKNEIATIHTTLVMLKETVKNDKNDFKKINLLGNTLSMQWNKIDSALYQNNPTAHVQIYQALYPIITLAKEDTPYIQKLRELIDPALHTLNHYR
ncbi:hypothetical protein NC661_11245 [Aquibacillus koreensis]|uniref:Uncharacterized protein n=1 Tax=Aquibacillus koreensis TaxID=279446 RepID=A0A9X3WP95_9BACI|nr:hypothetical protein [Aquibacillus koreensis]MCT2537709.1 hypothetical protein [Aquibacillus koreensis]MDC3420944.1 hypothetical protein [Aquibacillus koreensis]